MATRSILRKKSNLMELKIAVVGAASVGKSALIVRYLTKRYISEYDHKAENRYKHEVLVDGEPVMLEILDTCPKGNAQLPNGTELTQWADGLLLVYSIMDRSSFNYLRRATIDLLSDTPKCLVANKADMLHLRLIGRDEGELLSRDLNCKFAEVSAADQVDQVAEVFNDLCKDIIAARRKSKPSLLGRMLGSSRPYSRGKSDSNLPKD